MGGAVIESLADQLGGYVHGFSLVGLLLSFLGGSLTGFNPCAYATIPVLIGLLGSQDAARPRWHPPVLAMLFVAGTGVTYVLIGLAVSEVGRMLGLSERTWHYLVAVVCLVFGLHWAGVFELDLPAWMPLRGYRPAAGSFLSALFLGVLFGFVASPCATPILAVILSAAAAGGSAAYGALLLFCYAVGHGLPLILIGLFAGAAGKIERAGAWMPVIQKASGWLLVGVAFYLALAA